MATTNNALWVFLYTSAWASGISESQIMYWPCNAKLLSSLCTNSHPINSIWEFLVCLSLVYCYCWLLNFILSCAYVVLSHYKFNLQFFGYCQWDAAHFHVYCSCRYILCPVKILVTIWFFLCWLIGFLGHLFIYRFFLIICILLSFLCGIFFEHFLI